MTGEFKGEEEAVVYPTSIMQWSGEQSIPQTAGVLNRWPVPLWCDECTRPWWNVAEPLADIAAIRRNCMETNTNEPRLRYRVLKETQRESFASHMYFDTHVGNV